jgi:hypothetical protein
VHRCRPLDLHPAAVRLLPGGAVTGPTVQSPPLATVEWPLQTIGEPSGSRGGELCVRPQVRFPRRRFSPTGDKGHRGEIRGAVGLGCRLTV